jgi:hypothetical protein
MNSPVSTPGTTVMVVVEKRRARAPINQRLAVAAAHRQQGAIFWEDPQPAGLTKENGDILAKCKELDVLGTWTSGKPVRAGRCDGLSKATGRTILERVCSARDARGI